MGDEWRTIELGELATVRSGYAFSSGDWVESGVPVVKIANVKRGRLEMSGCSYVSHAKATEAGDFQLKAGDILVAMTGYVGDVARVRREDLPCVLNQRVGKFSLRDDGQLDENFLYCFLSWSETRKTIEGLGYGSAQPNVSPSLIHKVRLPLPPLVEQGRIAAMLGALDDKIDLNRRMNQTLEAMAQALFRSWFVDFDPVRAKAEGRQPEGMDAQTAALFPLEFEDGTEGPAGWRRSTVGQEFDVTMGQSPPGETYNEAGDGTPFFQGRADFGFRFPTNRVFCTAPTRMADAGATLVSVRAPVGDINVALERCAVGRGVAAVRGPNPSFTLYSMWSLRSRFEAFESEGTVFGAINKKDFHALPVIGPPQQIVARFEEFCSPLDARIRANELESRTLTDLRDVLLPKLLSGEIRLGEAEDAVAKAV